MQSTLTRVQQPAIQSPRLSARFSLSNTLPAVSVRHSTRRPIKAPQAYFRPNSGLPFWAARAGQAILEEMLQEVNDVSSYSSAAKDFELPLAVDSAEEEDAYVFRADIPGVHRANLKVNLS